MAAVGEQHHNLHRTTCTQLSDDKRHHFSKPCACSVAYTPVLVRDTRRKGFEGGCKAPRRLPQSHAHSLIKATVLVSHLRDRRRAVSAAIGVLPANDNAVSLPAVRAVMVRPGFIRVRRARVVFHADRCTLSLSPPAKGRERRRVKIGRLEPSDLIGGVRDLELPDPCWLAAGNNKRIKN